MAIDEDTRIGGSASRFPRTRHSAILAARSADEQTRQRAFESIVAVYWKPVYKYIRIRWRRSNEEAKDLTQGFFSRVIEKDYLESYDPAKASFRTFLRTCVDAYTANQAQAARRLKRGGGATLLPLDFESAEGELQQREVPDPGVFDMDEYFRREWIRGVFSLAVEQLRAECARMGKTTQFQAFERYDLCADADARPTYEKLAAELGVTSVTLTNYLASMRRSFRKTALAALRGLTATGEEYRREARALLGVDAD